MRRIPAALFLFALTLTPSLFSQQAKEPAADSVFAYALNAKQLITIDGSISSDARPYAAAVCPTRAIRSSVTLAGPTKGAAHGRSGIGYEATEEVPPNHYCMLVDSRINDTMFVWGSGDERYLYREKGCLDEIAKAAEDLTGRKPATCFNLGAYGTGQLELVDYVAQSADDRLAALLMIDYSEIGDTKYSILRFPANSKIWAADSDGRFHPERFQHLFTIGNDSEHTLWSVAIEWDGPQGADLTLYRPVGKNLKPIVVNHDPLGHKNLAEIAQQMKP